VIILLGPPGSGKGTQAARLSQELSLPHVSTGDLFRENRAKGTELGKRAQGFMDSGKLVPDELVLDMLFDRVGRPDCRRGYLLDGFPRTLPQAAALETRLGNEARMLVLNLRVPDAVIVERVTGRRTCKQCGHIQHIKYSPPKVPGRCDKCGSELVQRSDDTAEVVEKRLATYREQTQPLEGFYAKMGVLREIDGNRAPDEVFKALRQLAQGNEAA
jgi:adenylate kinase